MKNRVILITLASLMALTGCKQNPVEDKSASFDWDNNDKLEYIIDYTVHFTADHDSTIQVAATGNYGTVKVVQVESENLLDADGNYVKNTFIRLEDSVPMGKSITLQRGGLTYGGGQPVFMHVQTVGSDDMVEIRIPGSDDCTMLYSIRDNMFYEPYDEQSITIGEGQRFSITLPVMTELKYPKKNETHRIQIGFTVAAI
ncbi:MAG: hypothetical protein IKH43_06830 [Bacteroidaceae bacterium]|nr:hypothetical protein [Bacteroidaceae bacterium]